MYARASQRSGAGPYKRISAMASPLSVPATMLTAPSRTVTPRPSSKAGSAPTKTAQLKKVSIRLMRGILNADAGAHPWGYGPRRRGHRQT